MYDMHLDAHECLSLLCRPDSCYRSVKNICNDGLQNRTAHSTHDRPALLALVFSQEVDSDLSNETHPEMEKGRYGIPLRIRPISMPLAANEQTAVRTLSGNGAKHPDTTCVFVGLFQNRREPASPVLHLPQATTTNCSDDYTKWE